MNKEQFYRTIQRFSVFATAGIVIATVASQQLSLLWLLLVTVATIILSEYYLSVEESKRTLDHKIDELARLTKELPFLVKQSNGDEEWRIKEGENYLQFRTFLCMKEDGFERALDRAIEVTQRRRDREERNQIAIV